MEKWMMRKDELDVVKTSNKWNIPIYLTKIITNRGILDYGEVENFLNPSLKLLHNPEYLPDVEIAFSIIENSLENEEHIRIIGDYDVDGIMSTYILYKSLKRIGAKVDYSIPHRVEDGYGLNKRLIDEALEDGVDLIITCDNGISAVKEISYAVEMGLSVIVTDHHEIPFDSENPEIEILPDADAIVNPKLKGSLYPFKEICGATVAFKLMEFVYTMLGCLDDDFYDLLQYVAIATVADVMELRGENRAIVKYGLEILNNTENKGLLKLFERLGKKDSEINSSDIGFLIGPVLNSTGRLKSAEIAIDFLISNDNLDVKVSELIELNKIRKSDTEKGAREAFSKIEENKIYEDKIILVKMDSVEESIIGIIAGRVKDRYNRPAIILTKSENCLKGSARSIDTYDIYQGLNDFKDLLLKFGGHSMAAGFSLEENNFEPLREGLNLKCNLEEEDFVKTYWADIKFPISMVTLEVANNIERLKPFGNGNEKPVFTDLNVKIKKVFLIGKNKNVLKFEFFTENGSIEGIMFRNTKDFIETVKATLGAEIINDSVEFKNKNQTIDLMYYPSINRYMGNQRLQLEIITYRFR
ncbi:MAG: single-stranded-DNA-specific exonuclease RecJ [Tissierellia bacterium]|nr:single-stranded-DNA-specific exonuclease RecJ [Tissierellia bacterium]